MRIPELTSLRFIFAVCIYLHHVQLYPSGGAMAVAVFFVLGGFCSAIGYKDLILSDSFNFKSYLKKKFLKLYPLHLLTLLVSALWLFYLTRSIDFKSLCLNALLVQSWVPKESVYFSYNALSWYLSDTSFFVLVFPILLKFLTRRKIYIIATLMALFIVYGVLWLFLPESYAHAVFYINPAIRLFDFIIGVLCGFAFIKLNGQDNVKHFVKSHYVAFDIIEILSLSFLFVLSFVLGVEVHSVYYWPVILVLLLSVSLNSGNCKLLNNNTLHKSGGATYAFYMVHVLCIQVGTKVLLHFGINNKPVTVILIFILSLSVAYLYTYKIHNRLTQWLT